MRWTAPGDPTIATPAMVAPFGPRSTEHHSAPGTRSGCHTMRVGVPSGGVWCTATGWHRLTPDPVRYSSDEGGAVGSVRRVPAAGIPLPVVGGLFRGRRLP